MPEYLLQQPASLKNLALTNLGKWIVLQADYINEKIQPELKVDKRTKLPRLICNEYVKEIRHLTHTIILRSQGEALVHRLIQIIQNHIIHLHDDSYSSLMTELIPAIDAKINKRFTFTYKKKVKPAVAIEIDRTFTFPYKNKVYMIIAENLFTSQLTSLRLMYPVPMERCLPLLCSLSHKLTRLTRLELKLSLLPHRIKEADSTLERDIIAILRPLHALKILSLTSYCTDEILKCVVENCTLIEDLDISQSGTRVNDNSVRLLTQLSCLRSVHLSGTSVGPSGIAELLFACGNLEHFDITAMFAHMLGCSYVSNQKYEGRVFKLNTFDTGASFEQLMFLAQICPHIQNMSLRKCGRDTESNLRALPEFKSINQLKLDGYDLYDDPVTDTLRDIGRNLRTLHLNGVKKLNVDMLIHISQTCPFLQNLSIDCCDFIRLRSVYEDFRSLKIPPFRNLEKFSVGIHNVIPEPSAIMFVLCNCWNVEFIHLTSSILCLLTEELMLQVLDKNPLKYLKELSLWHKYVENVVTMNVLDRIKQNSMSGPVVRRSPVSPI